MPESSEISGYSDEYSYNLCGQKIFLYKSIRNKGTNVLLVKHTYHEIKLQLNNNFYTWHLLSYSCHKWSYNIS